MHRFERDAIELIVGSSIVAAEVRSQLEYAATRERTASSDALVTYFDVADAAPTIVPGDLEMAEDLDVDAYGVITASITVASGRLSSLAFSMPARHWPKNPRILGVAPEP